MSPKVTDFGLAKKLDEQGATRTGSVMGTPSYMPPEQAEGKKDIGPTADVYSLGAILYECLASRSPFRAATPLDTILQVLTQEPVPVRQLNPQARVDLETICAKCLQKDPKKGYATARELADDLGCYLGGEPILARPVGAIERAVKWVRRNAVVATLAGSMLLVLVSGILVSSFFAVTASQEAAAARKAEKDAEDRAQAEAAAKALAQSEQARADREAKEAKLQTRRAEEQLGRAECLVYASRLSLAQSALTEGRVDLAHQYLDECQWDLRGWEHRYLWMRINARQTLSGHTNQVSSVAFSPDGQRIVTASFDHTARVWNAETAQEILSLKGHRESVTSVAYSPDGQRILTGSEDNTAKVWDAKTGQEVFALKKHTNFVTTVAFSPDGKRIVTGSDDDTAKVWDAKKGEEIFTLKGHLHYVTSVAYSPDGKRIVTGSNDKTAKVWDATEGVQLLSLKGHTQQVSSVVYSPDGKRILTGSYDNTARIWDAASGPEVFALKGHSQKVTCVLFSSDGKRIVTGGNDNTARVWEADKGQEFFTLEWETHSLIGVAFSSDGKRVFAWDFQNKVQAWSLRDGKLVEPDNPPAKQLLDVALSPDGRLRAERRGSTIVVFDPRRVAESKVWPLPDAAERWRYHREQATRAEKEKQWFAVAFHVGRLLIDSPDDADLKHRRAEALRHHAAKE